MTTQQSQQVTDPSQRMVYAGYRDGVCVAIMDHTGNRTAKDRRETAREVAEWIRSGLEVRQATAREACDNMLAALNARRSVASPEKKEGE
ncbi:hypothetical protein [Azospirillum sp.]|uniref:hypothetical protein n=1 Tax=Azospirillum sp. TaxID=34012 RepID=UPI003D730AE7